MGPGVYNCLELPNWTVCNYTFNGHMQCDHTADLAECNHTAYVR